MCSKSLHNKFPFTKKSLDHSRLTLSCCGNMAPVERFTVLITLVLLVHCGEQIVNGVISDVRLVGGPTPDRGTVEITQNNGSWETTCGVNLGINDVIVICRQLGFTGASRAIQDTPYGQNSTPFGVLNCGGDEANLTECALLQRQMCSIAGAASCHGEDYLGCFVDRMNDRVLPGERLVADPHVTISYCIEFCKKKISAYYVYAGVENGEECFCGVASDNYTRYGVGSDANCQSPCSGDHTEGCGGSRYIAVFRVSNLPSTSTAVPTLTSTYQNTVRHTTVQSQSPTNPGVESTNSIETGRPYPASSLPPMMTSTDNIVHGQSTTDPGVESTDPVETGRPGPASSPRPLITTTDNIAHSQSPTNPGVESTDSVETGRTRSASSPPPVMTATDNIGLYAGVAGGVVAIVIVVVIIIVVVMSMRKRSRRQQKDRLQSHDMTVMQPASSNGTKGTLYHNMFQDNPDETPHGLQLPDPPTDGDVTYYSSVKYHETPGGEDTYYSSVKDQKLIDTDSKLNNVMPSYQNDGLSEKGVARTPPNDDLEVMNGRPDKTRKSQKEEDFGSLYAKHDTTGKGGDGQGSEDFGAPNTMADKSRGVPKSRKDGSQVGLENGGNSGEGLFSLADDDTGLYAMSTAPGHTVNNDDNEYGTVMVDNELYAM